MDHMIHSKNGFHFLQHLHMYLYITILHNLLQIQKRWQKSPALFCVLLFTAKFCTIFTLYNNWKKTYFSCLQILILSGEFDSLPPWTSLVALSSPLPEMPPTKYMSKQYLIRFKHLVKMHLFFINYEVLVISVCCLPFYLDQTQEHQMDESEQGSLEAHDIAYLHCCK